jgi:hypothetical protein
LLRTGRKFPVPFDGMVLFSTNLSLTDVADEGMLRRLHSKIEVSEPKEEYAHIWAQLCRERDIILPPGVVPFLEENLYAQGDVPRAGYHPRYLLDQVAAMCKYRGLPMQLDRTLIELAWRNLFTH